MKHLNSFLIPAFFILLSLSATSQITPPACVGIMYNVPSDVAGDPVHDFSQDTWWSNPHVQGVALRTSWDRVEPHEHTNANDFNWTFLDTGVAYAVAHGKKFYLQVLPGYSTPQWVYNAGAQPFIATLTGLSSFTITDGVTTAGSTTVTSNTGGWGPKNAGTTISGGSLPAGTTIVAVNSSKSVTVSNPAGISATGVTISTGNTKPMPLPWDSVFQSKWFSFLQVFLDRYKNNLNLAYVCMQGYSRTPESFFGGNDTLAIDSIAQAQGFANNNGWGYGLSAWYIASKRIIDEYASQLAGTSVPFQYIMGNPWTPTNGQQTQQAICDYADSTYYGRFSVANHGLYPNAPLAGQPGADEILKLSPHALAGYEQGNYAHSTSDMQKQMTIGLSFGMRFCQVWANNCDDPAMWPYLDSAAAVMLSSCTATNIVNPNKNDAELFITVFPNPSASETKFTFSEEFDHAQFKLIEVNGKEVKSISFSGKEVLLEKEALQDGIYFYTIFSSGGSKSGKLIIQNK